MSFWLLQEHKSEKPRRTHPVFLGLIAGSLIRRSGGPAPLPFDQL